jgi:hypothetical protein
MWVVLKSYHQEEANDGKKTKITVREAGFSEKNKYFRESQRMRSHISGFFARIWYITVVFLIKHAMLAD